LISWPIGALAQKFASGNKPFNTKFRFRGGCMGKEDERVATEVVIAKEQAVFRLDGNGCWHNDGGRFRNKKIIDFFNRSIRRDADGYHLFQVRGDIREKVYFPYEDTALFVFEVLAENDSLTLGLNTGARIRIDPNALFVRRDQLYLEHGGERIKFTDRSLMALSKWLGFQDGRYILRLGAVERPIPQRDD